jgi:hypothetical protein
MMYDDSIPRPSGYGDVSSFDEDPPEERTGSEDEEDE